MARIVVGVAGGIAAYKVIEVVRRLRESGHAVRVVPTEASLNFVGAATWQAISGEPVVTGVFEDTEQVAHVRLGQEADLVLVAPATADLLARAATGRADDLLTNVLLTSRAPVVMVPAMHTEMWEHAATRANVATLRSRGVVVVDPAEGRLTGKDSGPGRLPEPADIHQVAESLLESPDHVPALAEQDLRGLRVVISAGGTREPLDPVRFLGNASSGLMGIALARAARLRGAEVTLVTANVGEGIPAGCRSLAVTTTGELEATMRAEAAASEVVVMAAAVADYRPAQVEPVKQKKSGDDGLSLELVQTTDILRALVEQRRESGASAATANVSQQTIVGFAAETASGEALDELAEAKLRRKGCDLLVANDVSGGQVFGADTTTIHLLATTEGPRTPLKRSGPWTGSKSAVAHRVWDGIIEHRVDEGGYRRSRQA